MKKNLLVPMMLVLMSSVLFVSASNTIGSTSLSISINNGTLQIVSPDYPVNNQNFTFDSNSNETQTFNLSLLFVENQSVGSNIVDQLTACLVNLSTKNEDYINCNIGYNSCTNSNTNLTNQIANYQNTTQDYQTCQNQLTSSNSQISSLQTEVNNSKNQPYIWGIGMFVLGFGICYVWKNGGFKSKAKEKGKQNMPLQTGQ